MKKHLLMLAAAGLFALPTAAAQATEDKLFVFHGIPGEDLRLAPDLPVGISVNGDGALQGFTFGEIAGSIQIPAAT
jgi:hypothetical protein